MGIKVTKLIEFNPPKLPTIESINILSKKLLKFDRNEWFVPQKKIKRYIEVNIIGKRKD